MTTVPNASRLSNEQLMRAAQGGDHHAFGLLYRRLAPAALRLARGLVRGEAGRAHDAVQDGFLSIWNSRAQYRPELGSVESWAFTVVRNRAHDATRRQSRHDLHRDHLDENLLARGCPGRSPHEQLLAAETASRLRELLCALPVEQREVIALAYLAELSHTEIALRLDLPLGTIKGRMRLGLHKLHDCALA